MKISKISNAVGRIRSVCVRQHFQIVSKVFLTSFIISMKSTSTFEKHIRTMHETYVSDEFLTMQFKFVKILNKILKILYFIFLSDTYVLYVSDGNFMIK